jgi:uncharacterized membrane protein YphA (DoxX/SURF4 family)
MWSMTDSMAQAARTGVPLDVSRGRHAAGWISAVAVALLFLISGLWKVTDAQGAAVRMAQARVPESLSLTAALAFGIVETVAAVMLFVPRLRRWGAILATVLLLAFLAWFAIHYNVLRGAECSCFPWLKRAVGPGFFIGDALMLAMAVAAAALAPRSYGVRNVALIAGAVTVFAFVSWGVNAARQTGTPAPESILVDGRPFDAAERMSKLNWGATRVVGVPITKPQFAAQFAADTGFAMPITADHDKLKQIFSYTAVPAGIALENGRQKAALVKFEGSELAATLKGLGLIQ